MMLSIFKRSSLLFSILMVSIIAFAVNLSLHAADELTDDFEQSHTAFLNKLTPEEKAWLKAHPVIKIGIGDSWAPFVYIKNGGELEGYDVDFATMINALTGTNIQIVAGQWKDIVAQAERREIDGLAESAVVESRREYFAFTDPYNMLKYAAATIPEKAAAIRSMSDLKGKKIAYLKGNAWVRKIIDSIGEVQTVDATSEEEAFRFVVQGKSDFALVPVYQYAPLRKIYHQALAFAYVFTQQKFVLKTVYSIRKDWPELVSIINKALSAFDVSDKLALFDKWVPMGAVSTEYARPKLVLLQSCGHEVKPLS